MKFSSNGNALVIVRDGLVAHRVVESCIKEASEYYHCWELRAFSASTPLQTTIHKQCSSTSRQQKLKMSFLGKLHLFFTIELKLQCRVQTLSKLTILLAGDESDCKVQNC